MLRIDDDAVDVIDGTPVPSLRRTEHKAFHAFHEYATVARIPDRGITSILDTRPSARIQNRTSCLVFSSGGAPWGTLGTNSGVGPKISLAAPPEPGPESDPTPVPVPVPFPPPVPGASPGPPAVPSPVPTAAGEAGAIVTVGGGTSSVTGSTTGGATVGTVTAGAGGTSCSAGVDGVGSANQLIAGRPPPPPPPRGPDPPPPPPSNSSAPRQSTRMAMAMCTASESAAAGPCRRRGSGSE